MKIFITGSSGFIGFHLSQKLLDKGHSVHGFDSMNNYYDVKLKKARYQILNKYKNFFFTKGNLENQKILSKSILNFKPKVIIHLAAQAGVRYSIEKPRVYLNSNIIGTYNVIELAKKINVKHLIIASSSSVYGANKNFPFKEIDKTETQLSIYAATKKSTESIAHSCSNLWQVPITMLRFFTVYGPWGRPDMAYYLFAEAISNNKPINVFNKGEMERDFTYIDDIVIGVTKIIEAKLLDREHYKIYNIGNNKTERLSDFISLIEKYLNKSAIKKMLPMQPGDVTKTWANIDEITRDFNYQPKTSVKTGIFNFINWYLKYKK